MQKTSSTLKSGRTKLTAEQQMAQTLATRNTNFSEIYTEATSTECIENCNDKYTDKEGNKKKGRGACKFNCWVETVKEIIDDLAKIL